MNIRSIRISDGGDGSTILQITEVNGKEHWEGPDVPYDGHVTLHFEDDGNIREEVVWED